MGIFRGQRKYYNKCIGRKLNGYKPGRKTNWVGTKKNGHIRVYGV